jgi:hypothetical protein
MKQPLATDAASTKRTPPKQSQRWFTSPLERVAVISLVGEALLAVLNHFLSGS